MTQTTFETPTSAHNYNDTLSNHASSSENLDADQIEALQKSLLDNAETIRKEQKITPELISKLVDGVEKLINSPAPEFIKAHVAAEVAADIHGVVPKNSPVIELANEQLQRQFGERTGDPAIDAVNLESFTAYGIAIHETDEDVPFGEALIESESQVDKLAGRKSFETDVIIPTEIKVELQKERREQIAERDQRLTITQDFEATGAVAYNPFDDDGLDDTQDIFDPNKLRKHVSFNMFKVAVRDDENERVVSPREAEVLRLQHPVSQDEENEKLV